MDPPPSSRHQQPAIRRLTPLAAATGVSAPALHAPDASTSSPAGSHNRAAGPPGPRDPPRPPCGQRSSGLGPRDPPRPPCGQRSSGLGPRDPPRPRCWQRSSGLGPRDPPAGRSESQSRSRGNDSNRFGSQRFGLAEPLQALEAAALPGGAQLLGAGRRPGRALMQRPGGPAAQESRLDHRLHLPRQQRVASPLAVGGEGVAGGREDAGWPVYGLGRRRRERGVVFFQLDHLATTIPVLTTSRACSRRWSRFFKSAIAWLSPAAARSTSIPSPSAHSATASMARLWTRSRSASSSCWLVTSEGPVAAAALPAATGRGEQLLAEA